MDKKQQEFEASTGKHFSCGQDFCKQCGLCSHCFCRCKQVKRIKIGIIRQEDIIYVYSDRPDEVKVEIVDLDNDNSINANRSASVIQANMQEI